MQFDTTELNDFLNTDPFERGSTAAPKALTVPVRQAPSVSLGWDAVMALPVPAYKPKPVVKRPHDGTYTVVRADGTHRTYRVRTQDANATFAPGETIASKLFGPDNESSFVQVGFLKDDPIHGCRIVLYKKFRTAAGDRMCDDLLALMGDPKACASRYGLMSGKCGICGRKLTVPESIEAGIGPVCASKF